jgi:hypothetical protein
LLTGVTLYLLILLIYTADLSVAESLVLALQHNLGLVFAAIALVPINYGLEAFKWKLLTSNSLNLSYWQCVKTILVGHAFGAITPGRLGEYLGRTLLTDANKHQDAIAATFISRFAQLLPTLGAGLLCAWALGASALNIPLAWNIAVAILGALVIASATLYPKTYFRLLAIAFRRLIPIRWFWRRIIIVPETQLRTVVRLAFVRYLVFSSQYMLLIVAFWPHESEPLQPLKIGLVVILTYFIKSFIPSFTLAELGIRETIAVSVAEMLKLAVPAVFSATASLFMLNILLPALAGGGVWLHYVVVSWLNKNR